MTGSHLFIITSSHIPQRIISEKVKNINSKSSEGQRDHYGLEKNHESENLIEPQRLSGVRQAMRV